VRVKWRETEDAEIQLLEILDYVADESESAAIRVRDAIYDAVGKLAERPGIGHTREYLTRLVHERPNLISAGG
jgi:plasmid stabilization system protein ParE